MKPWRTKCQRRGLGNILNQCGFESARKNDNDPFFCVDIAIGSELNGRIELEIQIEREEN